jgi:hypothetical protein
MAKFSVNSSPKYSTMNFREPCEGAAVLVLDFDFTTAGSYDVDLSGIENSKEFSMVQSIYIDNSDTDSAMVISINGTRQRIVANGRTCGYYSVLCPNPTLFNVASAANALKTVHFINSPIPGNVWAATKP